MKTKNINWIFAGIAIILSSCNSYLSEYPNKGSNQPLTTSAQVEALINNSQWLTSLSYATAYSSDDFKSTPEMYDAASSIYATDMLPQYIWAIDDIETSGSDELWNEQFNRIFTANLILNDIDEVKDLTDTNRTEYLAQAHFLRAMAYWQLVNIYCQPYAADNLQSLGLPLKQTTSYEESLTRATLKETYQFIENDLKEALNTNKSDIDNRWLVSKPAVQAMLARFYLFTEDYSQAVSYATEALKSNKVTLQDYNELGHVEGSVWSNNTGNTITVEYPEFYGYSPLQYTAYKELYYSEMYKIVSSPRLIPSETLVSLFDKDNDLRYQQFFVKSGTVEYGLEGFGDDLLYRQFYYSNSYSDMMPSGPSISEMLLTLAEAEAREGNYEQSMNTVNKLREKRMVTGSNYQLTATSKEEAIKQILDERHREMPFMMRWMDIRRLAYNEDSNDDVTITRTFYKVRNRVVDTSSTETYTLPIKSKRYAQPLLNVEISRSNGQLKQNEY